MNVDQTKRPSMGRIVSVVRALLQQLQQDAHSGTTPLLAQKPHVSPSPSASSSSSSSSSPSASVAADASEASPLVLQRTVQAAADAGTAGARFGAHTDYDEPVERPSTGPAPRGAPPTPLPASPPTAAGDTAGAVESATIPHDYDAPVVHPGAKV